MDRRKTDNLRRLKINQLVLLGIVSENNNENNLLINYFVAKNVNKNVDSNGNSNSNSSNNELRNGDNEIRNLISDDTDNGYGHDEVVILFILIFLTMNHFFTSYRCIDLQMFVFK